MQIRESFRPRYRGDDVITRVSANTFAGAIKSAIEVIKMSLTFQQNTNGTEDSATHQAMAYILNGVAMESCQWVRIT